MADIIALSGRDTVPTSSSDREGLSEYLSGFSKHEPSIWEKISAVGANIPEGGFRSAFYIAQPSSLIIGFLIVMVFSFICMFIAIFVDMSGNQVFTGIALGLPWAIMLCALFAQWLENKGDDNRYSHYINYNIKANKDTLNVNKV